jgi:uncharacterized membrane protein YciS (DUF1049 family)
MLRILLLLLLILVFVGGLAVGYSNAGPVSFNYLFGKTELSLVVLVLTVFAVAVLLTLLVCAGRILRLSADLRRLRRQLREAETELKNLRNIPIGAGH